MNRIYKLLQLIKPNTESLIIYDNANLNYLTESLLFNQYNRGLALVSSKYCCLFVSPLIETLAKQQIKNFTEIISLDNQKIFPTNINKLISKYKIKNIGIEEEQISYRLFQQLKKLAISLVNAQKQINSLRQIKDAQEILKIKKAIKITKAGLNYIKQFIKPGVKETDISWQLEKYWREKGFALAFPTIVASGPNSSIPHYQAGKRKLASNDLVIIDCGVKVDGYGADLTRTFFIGQPKPEWQRNYQIVYKAQQKAFNYLKIKKMPQASKLDFICREYFKKHRLDNYFIHSLGHGVGLEVHEAPHLSPHDQTILQKNMVVTIEPGLYFPHKFGIRIEDTVII